jgi:flagellar protein FliS
MNPQETAMVYKTQRIMTASPEELTLLLYSGAVRFVAENIQALARGQMEQAHTAHLRAQEIIRYLMDTLNMDYEISKNLFLLYDYLEWRLNQANLKRDIAQLEEAKGLLAELRDTWSEAMKKARIERSSGSIAAAAGAAAQAGGPLGAPSRTGGAAVLSGAPNPVKPAAAVRPEPPEARPAGAVSAPRREAAEAGAPGPFPAGPAVNLNPIAAYKATMAAYKAGQAEAARPSPAAAGE